MNDSMRPCGGRMAVLGLVVAVAVGSVGCGSPSPDEVSDEYADYLSEVADVLDTIQTPTDVDAGVGRLRALVRDSYDLADRAGEIEHDAARELSTEAKTRQNEQGERISAGRRRLEVGGFLRRNNRSSEHLYEVLWEVSRSQIMIVAYTKAGRVPDADTPLEQAYVDLIANLEQESDFAARIDDIASARGAMDGLKTFSDERHAIRTRLAELGAQEPPAGVPDKYDSHYGAAAQRMGLVELMLNHLPDRTQVIELFRSELLAEQASRPNPFSANSNVGKPAEAGSVIVTLKNNRSLAGPRHQKMMAALKERAGAKDSRAYAEGDDHCVALSPVHNVEQFAESIDFGTVSNLDVGARRFVLTIDAAKFPETPKELPPFASGEFVVPGLEEGDYNRINFARKVMIPKNGVENLVVIHLLNCQAFDKDQLRDARGTLFKAAQAKGMKTAYLGSGDCAMVYASSEDVDELAAKLKLGKVESVDSLLRYIVIRLEEGKLAK